MAAVCSTGQRTSAAGTLYCLVESGCSPLAACQSMSLHAAHKWRTQWWSRAWQYTLHKHAAAFSNCNDSVHQVPTCGSLLMNITSEAKLPGGLLKTTNTLPQSHSKYYCCTHLAASCQHRHKASGTGLLLPLRTARAASAVHGCRPASTTMAVPQLRLQCW